MPSANSTSLKHSSKAEIVAHGAKAKHKYVAMAVAMHDNSGVVVVKLAPAAPRMCPYALRAQPTPFRGARHDALGGFLGAQGSGVALPGQKSIGAVGGRYLVVHFSAIPPSERPGVAASLAI